MDFEIRVYCENCNSEISERDKVYCLECFSSLEKELEDSEAEKADLNDQLSQLEADYAQLEQELSRLQAQS